MKVKSVLFITTISSSIPSIVSAQEYQTFLDVSANRTQMKGEYIVNESDIETIKKYDFSQNSYAISGSYFFDKREITGPLNEFEYINKISHISSSYSFTDNHDRYSVGGNYFVNNFIVGGLYAYSLDDLGYKEVSSDFYSLNLGYLLSDDFVINISGSKNEDQDIEFNFSSSYNHYINSDDYIGFSYTEDPKEKRKNVSSKYFKKLTAGQYLTVGIYYHNNDNRENRIGGSASYYFDKFTSFSVTYNDDKAYSVGSRYYFNDNYSVQASYSSNIDSNDYNQLNIDLSAQF